MVSVLVIWLTTTCQVMNFYCPIILPGNVIFVFVRFESVSLRSRISWIKFKGIYIWLLHASVFSPNKSHACIAASNTASTLFSPAGAGLQEWPWGFNDIFSFHITGIGWHTHYWFFNSWKCCLNIFVFSSTPTWLHQQFQNELLEKPDCSALGIAGPFGQPQCMDQATT